MISSRQNQANVERDWTNLIISEVFGELIIQVLSCGGKLTDILRCSYCHSCQGVYNKTFFVSVTFIRNGNPRYL